jgi:hypothetical protein
MRVDRLRTTKEVRSSLRGNARTPGIWVCACYLGLALAYFWPALWFGLVPLPLLNPYAQPDPIWAPGAPADLADGTNLLLGDITGFYYPYLVHTIGTLRAGQFPLWSPELFGGIPFFASNQAAVLYPINLICYWFGPAHFWVVAALVRMLLAGAGTYLLARRLGGGRLGALLSGGLYMFAAFNIVWLHFAIHNVTALLPLALWLTLRLIDRPRRREGLALAGLIAAQLLGGHPETSVAFMLIWASFAAVWLFPRPEWWRPAGWLALAGALGIGLAAVQWLPTLALVSGSTTLAQRAFAAHSGAQSAALVSPVGALPFAAWGNLRYWLLLVSPELWGAPRGPQIYNWLPVRANYNELASYVGLVALPLAAFGAWRGPSRRAAAYFGVMLVLSVALLYPLPGLHLVGYLPVVRFAPGMRFGLGVTLGAAVLAGLGLDRLAGACARAQLRVAVALALLATLSLAILADMWGGRGPAWSLGLRPNPAARAAIAAVFQLSNWRLFLPAAAGFSAALALLAAARGWLRPRPLGALLAAIAVGELLLVGFGYNGFTQPQAIYPHTPVIDWLRRDGERFRVLNLDGTLWANSALTQGLEIPGGMEDLVPLRQQQFVQRGADAIVRDGDRRVAVDWGQRFMDMMNVRYVLTTGELIAGPRGAAYPLAFESGGVRVYRNPSALPRAYAAWSIVPARPRDAEDIVYNAKFDPWRAVVVEGAPPRELPPPAPGGAPIAPVPIRASEANRVVLTPDLPAPAVVVLAESYDPDWRVTVDGQPARLLRVNAIFRGVALPAGRHVVEFSYRPRLVIYGALLSAVALAGAAVLALWPRRPGGRAAPDKA